MDEDVVLHMISLIPVNTEEWGMPPFVPPKPGYKVIECDHCRQLSWIGPDQMAKKQEGQLPALCMVCIILIAKDQGVDPTGLKLTPVSDL